MTDRLWEIRQGDALQVLQTLPEGSVDCIVSSPPFWGLRDYQVDGQIGLEETPEAFLEALVAVFRECRRVLRPDGTLWVNLGDCYASSGGTGGQGPGGQRAGRRHTQKTLKSRAMGGRVGQEFTGEPKPKDLVGMPWRLALALQAGFAACNGCSMTAAAYVWIVCWLGAPMPASS